MRFNQRRFNSGRLNGGGANGPLIVYMIYSGDDAGGPIDYGHAIGLTDLLAWSGPPLAFSTSTRFGVRTRSGRTGLEEHNTDAQVLIVVGPAGEDLSNLPLPPVALTAVPKVGGTALVTWSYPYADPAVLPTGFHVYLTAGAIPDYVTPAATVPYGPSLLPAGFAKPQPGNYRATLSGLTNATSYVVAVRAYSAAGEEDNAVSVAVVGDDQAPSNVANLSATLASG